MQMLIEQSLEDDLIDKFIFRFQLMSPFFRSTHRSAELVNEIFLPTSLVAAPTFVTPTLNTLFVTSGNVLLRPYVPEVGAVNRTSPNGNVFLIPGLPTTGLPSYRLDF